MAAAATQQPEAPKAVAEGQVAPILRRVTPNFVVAIINDNIILRCLLSHGAAMVASEIAELRRPDNLSPGEQNQSLRCMLYSPNLSVDDLPGFAWDADIEVDSVTHFVGTVETRCEVIHMKWTVPITARRVQLKLHRLRKAAVRSKESDALAQKVVAMFQDPKFNPRSGSMPLQVVSEEVQRRFPADFRRVVGGEHCGSFRAFILSHEVSFAIFHYRDKEIANRNLSPSSVQDERVAIKKEVRDTSPPMLPPGHPHEKIIIQLLQDALKERDSHVHRLLRQLSSNDIFRVGMSAAFSSLMHWLQRHRNVFRWSTDPQQLCTIGLVPGAKFSPITQKTSVPRPVGKPETDEEDEEASDTGGQEEEELF